MKLDISTLAMVSCLTFLAQSLALLVQFIVNRVDRGVRWWLVGSTFMAIGVMFMPLVAVKSLELLARIANPLVVLGHIFLYIGVLRFLDKKENSWSLLFIYAGFLFFYFYFMLVDNTISGRSIVLIIVIAVLSAMTAFRLFRHNDRTVAVSGRFTAFVFLAYALFLALRFYWVVSSPPMQAYSDQQFFLALSFIFPIVSSLLWTFGFVIMLNQRLNAENRGEKEKLQLIFNTSPDAAMISRMGDGSIVDVNAGFLEMSGYARAEVIGNTTVRLNIWHRLEDRESFVKELNDYGICENREFSFQRKDGRLITGMISAKIIAIQSTPHVINIVHDISKSKQAADALRESEELYRTILNASPDDITITDLQGRIQVISPAAKKMFGYEPEFDRFVGSQLLDYIVPEEREKARANLVHLYKGDYLGPSEYHAIRQDQSIFDIEVNSGLIYGANGQPARMVFIVRNITERKQAEQHIQNLLQQLEREKKIAQRNANTDSLTELANRRYFDEMFSAEFHRLKRSGLPMSLIMLDVDRFKKFNDRYGHLAGDDCLKQIGSVLKMLVGRSTDLAARFGGEEFMVVLTETDQQGAAILAERIRQAIEALAIPHAESDIAQWVTVSLGVTTMHTTSLASPDQMVRLADQALYCAKEAGRNQVSIAPEKQDAFGL